MRFIKSDFIRNSGVLFSSTGIAQLISFLIIPILARIYSPEEHGAVTLFTSIVSVCVAFSCLRYEQAIVIETDHEKAKHLVYLSLLLNLAWCLLFYLLLVLFNDGICGLLGITGSGSWLFLVPATIVFSSCVEILVMWYNRQRRYGKLATNRVVGMATGSAYKLAHPFTGLTSGNGLIMGHVIGQLIQMAMLIPAKAVRKIHISKKLLTGVASSYKSFPMLATPSALVNIIGSFMPVFIISAMLGEAVTGFYGNAVKLTFIPLSAVSYAVGQVYFERLARLRESEEERVQLSYDLLKFLFLLTIIPVVVLMVWGDVLVTFILGDDWSASGSMAQITALYFFVMYLSSPFSAAFEVFGKLGRQLMYTAVFTLLTSVALYVGLKLFDSIVLALLLHSFIGILIRLAMMYDCFRLIGTSLFREIFKGLFITAGLTLLLFGLKMWLL